MFSFIHVTCHYKQADEGSPTKKQKTGKEEAITTPSSNKGMSISDFAVEAKKHKGKGVVELMADKRI